MVSIMTASSSVRVDVAAGDDRAGMRAVGDAARVERERRLLDPATAAEPAADVIEHLVGLHVRVGVGHLDRLGVRVEHPRRERAEHEPGRVERLLHRRRLVDRAGDRLEVVGVERVRIDHAVPADDVERMVRQRVARQPACRP